MNMIKNIHQNNNIKQSKKDSQKNNTSSLLMRDHRQLGKQLNLYHFQDEAPGMVFWHHNGYIIFQELETFLRKKLQQYNYQEVRTPIITDSIIWENTGHWEIYKKAMFITSSENRKYCIKPMNCPGHIQIFKHKLMSYKNLPVRIAEFGICHRNEPSGSLHGLMRLRSFTQDDAHIFCTKEHITQEITNCIHMMYEIYNIFGFKKIRVKLSTRPDKRIGNDNIWNYTESHLSEILHQLNIIFEYQNGEGAFYGPKIEFSFFDCSNREWQCGTIQLDCSLSKKLNLFYIDHNNRHQYPIIIHRAILGSLERFIGIILEEFHGYLPLWIVPLQVIILNINSKHNNYIMNIVNIFMQHNIRIKADLSNNKISFKIRQYTMLHIPYIFICGDQEIQNNTITIRNCLGENLGFMKIHDIINKIKEEIQNYKITQYII
ncbi:threonine--tRNA ligase [Enterobacteriaceae endosymbiont of Macroplea appendiculata]|nr:threonine--tRNA ligase [Enterobacteriaceae endosymbiont of Macroplea appendiculata]